MANNTRRPMSYTGVGHVTIGSDIQAVLQVVLVPEASLGHELARQLREVKPSGWYPISLLLGLLERVEARHGAQALVNTGAALFRLSHEAAVRNNARCARDIIYGIDGMYKRANRGYGIGGWKVTSFSPGRAELEKTTPHHCVLEEGLLGAALLAVGVSAEIEQSECLRHGANLCRYVVTSSVTDDRWGK